MHDQVERDVWKRTVWKFDLPVEDYVWLEMPAASKILHVGMQDGVLRLWAIVNPDAHLERREFRICGTGHEINRRSKWEDVFEHVGTVMDGPFVWHVFEIADVPF